MVSGNKYGKHYNCHKYPRTYMCFWLANLCFTVTHSKRRSQVHFDIKYLSSSDSCGKHYYCNEIVGPTNTLDLLLTYFAIWPWRILKLKCHSQVLFHDIVWIVLERITITFTSHNSQPGCLKIDYIVWQEWHSLAPKLLIWEVVLKWHWQEC